MNTKLFPKRVSQKNAKKCIRAWAFGLRRRNRFHKMIKDLGFVEAVEVGVFKGGFSRYLLVNTPLKKLYSIDPWKNNRTGEFLPDIHQEAADVLSGFGDRSELVVGSSPDIASLFKDESLDFVYIDADHGYESAKADINAWWLKVRTGGVLAGHDYKNRFGSMPVVMGGVLRRGCGVKRAVDEFVEEAGVVLFKTRDGVKSWWILKGLTKEDLEECLQ